MNDSENYLLNLQGFLHIPELLLPDEAHRLFSAATELEEHALACQHCSPQWKALWGTEYWQNRRHSYFAT